MEQELIKERQYIYDTKKEKFTKDKGGHIDDIDIAIDCGSTETRTLSYSRKNLAKGGNIFAIDSAYGVVDFDISNIRSKSDSMYDNLELNIIDETSDKSEKIFTEIKVVKGRLLQDVDVTAERLASDVGKAAQDMTYINIVSNIAIKIAARTFSTGSLSNLYHIDLTVALTTEDTSNKKRLENFKKKLAGTYSVQFPRFDDMIVRFSLSEDRIFVESEAKSAMRFWATKNNTDLDSISNAILIDGGGRSMDYSLLHKGVLIERANYTGEYGGTKFKQSIIDRLMSTRDMTAPSIQMIEDALPTGQLQDGNNFIDITEDIKAVKKDYAKKVMTDIDTVMTKAEIKANQINVLITCGRLFRKSVNANAKVAGLNKFIEVLFKKKNDSIEVSQIPGEFPICWGLVFFRVSLDD